MRIESLRAHGFASLVDVDLDLREIGPGLIAITGNNGSGKTTLLEIAPGAIYRQLPARNGENPVNYATGRDSFLDVMFSIEGRGAFRSRLNLDGTTRKSDAVLEQILATGERSPLSDGKVSTLDEAIRTFFPSFDLLINSSFAAQGRGDEFTRRKPSQRKDLFVEFLALQHYAAMAETASGAAGLVVMARLRLEAQIIQLERDTAPALADALHQQANTLQAQGGAAVVRQRELRVSLEGLETRASLLADQVAAYTVAAERVRTLTAARAARQADLRALEPQRTSTQQGYLKERAAVLVRRDDDVEALQKRIAGNEQIRTQAAAIRAAVAAIATIEPQLVAARRQLETGQTAQRSAVADLRAVEQQLAALVPIEQQIARATTDAGLLDTVPCGGAGEFAVCQFLTNATAAQARIADLEARVVPKAALADRVGALTRAGEAHATAIADVRRRITALEAERAGHQRLAAHDASLAAADARITELTGGIATVMAHADERVQAADRRRAERMAELEVEARRIAVTIGRLDADLSTAQVALDAATTGNSQAAAVLADLRTARVDWDSVTATLATVAAARQELEQRRADLAATRTRLADYRRRFALIDQELLEWRDLAKALGKGGLPDLEIDAAGPTISAQTNALLLACFGPRFSIELVTQVEKASGGMKDEFTVRVLDNEAAGSGWRDIAQLSGGEKTIVQEALMSAIAIYVNARSPMPIRTLWRDETGAALDPVNAVRYVEMLRKVQELGGYHHVFFISHNPAAAALADAQIQVGDGQAAIVYPPFAHSEAA